MAIGDVDTTNTTITEIQSTIDVSSPLYIHPSDSPGLVLVLVPFDGLGYRSWRRGVLGSLSVKNKQWEKCDNMVTSWILNSLAKEIVDSVEYVDTLVELWRELEDHYDQTNGAKLYQIQKKINDLSQGVLDITRYYTKMKKLWEELTNPSAKSVCNCHCTCGAKENMHKVEQDRRLIQFLMGLNEVYTVVRGSILMMNPLPSMAQTFALLVQEEKQREFRPRNQLNFESSAMNTSITTPRSFRTNFSVNNRPRPYCDFCKKQGHTKEKCFKLHGYSQLFNRQGAQSYNSNNYNQYPKNNRGMNITANVVACAQAMPSDTMSNQ
uniref:Uncharacterized protein LOC104230565 n=1 Tax=Nicotiana sylvestris TaxID=4096 RepID=A0A1U7WSY8_NICSY|nr:PREDICTED: uncharacterized protein LOC104230565 [Nicotiana sylvestris]